MRTSAIACLALILGVAPAAAQGPTTCRVLCTPEFKVEPTITFTTLFKSPQIILDDGAPTRDRRETDFELILSLGLRTRVSWLDFTVEAIFLPFEADSTLELEFETNFVWLPAQRTRGWLSSHFDVVAGCRTVEGARQLIPSSTRSIFAGQTRRAVAARNAYSSAAAESARRKLPSSVALSANASM